MGSREVCEHFTPIDMHCTACDEAGRQARLKVQQGVEECSICGPVARQEDGGPEVPLAVAQLERSLLDEIKRHDATKNRLRARERELERIRSNNYSKRVERYIKER